MVNCLIKTGCRCGELVVASLCAAKPVQAEPSLSWDRLQDKMKTGIFRICFMKKLYK